MEQVLADESTQVVSTACPVCGRQDGGEAVHSITADGGVVLTWAALPVCGDCAPRLAAGDVDIARLAAKARLLLGAYGFSAN